jgi:hypothetical protein
MVCSMSSDIILKNKHLPVALKLSNSAAERRVHSLAQRNPARQARPGNPAPLS